MDIVADFRNKVKGRGLRVALPEGEDERVLAAARKIVDEQIAGPILLGNPDKIEAAAKKIGVSLEGIKVINLKDNNKLDAYAVEYGKGREMTNHSFWLCRSARYSCRQGNITPVKRINGASR